MTRAAGRALLTIALCTASIAGAQVTESVASKATRSGKLRMALIPVDKSRDGDFTKPMIAAAFEDAMLKAGRFITLSRTEVGTMQAEQRFASSGAVDPASAIRLGKALSANYAVVVRQLSFDGKIVSASASLGRVKIPGVKSRTVYDVSLQAQAVDLETGEIVQSKTYTKALEGPARVEEARRPDAKETFADIYQKALAEFATAFTSELAAAIPLQAVVVLVRDADNIAINAGTNAGLRPGARFELIEEGGAIKDPSGAVLGYDNRKIGIAEVTRVDDRLAWLKVVQTFGPSGAADASPDISRVKQYLVARMVGTPR